MGITVSKRNNKLDPRLERVPNQVNLPRW